MKISRLIKGFFLMAVIGVTLSGCHLFAQKSAIRQQGSATQLIVDDRPFIILGGELGNSSASCNADIERIFPKLKRMGLNTVLVPAYWDLIEPQEGEFDFSLTEKVIDEARANDLRVVFLWFGAWKNSMSCYAPLWFKQDYKRFPRAMTKSGKPLEIASAFSENVFAADCRAFSRWLEFIADKDRAVGTVIMVQIENEIGMIEDARDHSKVANKAFNSAVPSELMQYLVKNKKTLHATLLAKWESQGKKKQGTWNEIFGEDIYTDEIFMAWHYALYVERMAQAARRIYDVPLYVNAAMNSRGRKPGQYPSAGPLAHLKDIWHCAAPSLDLLAPDLYDKGFTDWVAQYALPDNPLFIPEIRRSEGNAVQAFYVIGEYDALGLSPFSIEGGSDAPNARLKRGYDKLRELMPLIARHQGHGSMKGLWFDQEQSERIIEENGIKMTCRHYFTLPWDPRAKDGSTWPEAGGMIIRLSDKEYIVAGSGIVIEFALPDENLTRQKLGEDGFAATGGVERASVTEWLGKGRIGLGSVDEVSLDADGAMHYVRRLNGDEDHQGRHVRIGVDDFKILHVRLYEYIGVR